MKRFGLFVTAATLALLSLSGCQDNPADSSSAASDVSPTTQAVSASLSEERYTSGDQTFSLRVPSGWTASEEEDMVIFKGADYAETGDGLVITLLEDPMDSYTLDSLTQMFSSEKDFQKIDARELTIGGKKALLCQFSSTLNGRSSIQYQYLVDGGDKVYNLSYVIHSADLGQAVTASAESFQVS
jgi:hypothetical protein